ncbi:MAG: DUF2244 domain-containing protein [Alphaproteobacteria bacterium]
MFEAVLYPHRSLSPTGFAALMTGIAGVAFVAGVWFVAVGPWPVMPFFGLEVMLVYGAFRLNYRDARAFETVHLTAGSLLVEQVKPSGRRDCVSFAPPHWLQVIVERRSGHGNRLRLTSHGRSLVIGKFLTSEERMAFAGALRAALGRLNRLPSPQIRG